MSTLYNLSYVGRTIDDVWPMIYDDLVKDAETNVRQQSRDGAIVGEIINASIVIEDPTRCILKSSIRKMSTRYAIGELLWYNSGSNRLSDIQAYTGAWDRMSDDDATVNSNYGYCIQHKYGFNQMDYVYKLLSEHPESRQAVIHIKEARDIFEKPTKDVNCTVCLQFFIRDEKLHMTVFMRSNDAWNGTPYDIFQFTAMQIQLAMKLGIGIGTYTHLAGSLHLYERDYLTSLKNISADKFNDLLP